MARSPEERRTLAMTAIEAIGEGEFLTSVSKRMDIPYSTIVTWIDSDKELSEMYSRARVQGYMKRMEDIEDDAQKLMDDVKIGAIPDPGPTIAAFKELRCIRQWNAGKFAKGLFGEKVEATLQNPDGSAVKNGTTVIVDASVINSALQEKFAKFATPSDG
jgi:hypothetical protein